MEVAFLRGTQNDYRRQFGKKPSSLFEKNRLHHERSELPGAVAATCNAPKALCNRSEASAVAATCNGSKAAFVTCNNERSESLFLPP